jgi:FAD/FMN-containing dehydrogenase
MSAVVNTVSQARAALVERLGADVVLTDPAEHVRYCRDWHGDVTSATVAVLRPRSTEQVSQAMRACADLGLAVVPQGGNTGLVLAGIPDQPEHQVVISLERMNRIRHIDADDFSAVVEAGCIVANIKAAADEAGMLFPLGFGAEGSAQIGGSVGTNAGGINVLRYGMTRELVLGLEVVLPDGNVWNGITTLRKDNRGISLRQLFIGAEGTLGIVTAVALKLLPKPTQVETALLGVASLHDAIALYRRARVDCCDLMTAFEFMPPEAFMLAIEAQPDLKMPIAGDYPAYVLMELSGSGLVDVKALLDRFLENVLEDGMVQDGVVAASRAQGINLWRFREGMNEGQAMRGVHLRTDVSVSLGRLAEFVDRTLAALKQAFPDSLSIAYGHVGDGNAHINVLPPAGADIAERQRILYAGKNLINDLVYEYEGSISAEHGIGRLKRPEFEQRLAPAHRELLLAIRKAIDPDGRMNPGCQVLPD